MVKPVGQSIRGENTGLTERSLGQEITFEGLCGIQGARFSSHPPVASIPTSHHLPVSLPFPLEGDHIEEWNRQQPLTLTTDKVEKGSRRNLWFCPFRGG